MLKDDIEKKIRKINKDPIVKDQIGRKSPIKKKRKRKKREEKRPNHVSLVGPTSLGLQKKALPREPRATHMSRPP